MQNIADSAMVSILVKLECLSNEVHSYVHTLGLAKHKALYFHFPYVHKAIMRAIKMATAV